MHSKVKDRPGELLCDVACPCQLTNAVCQGCLMRSLANCCLTCCQQFAVTVHIGITMFVCGQTCCDAGFADPN